MRPCRERAGGFTLLEVACTLVVLALAAGVVTARLAARASALDEAAATIARRATAARWRAVLTGRPVALALGALPAGVAVVPDPAALPSAAAPRLTFAPLPEARERTLVLADARGRRVTLRIPPGLQPIGVAAQGSR